MWIAIDTVLEASDWRQASDKLFLMRIFNFYFLQQKLYQGIIIQDHNVKTL